MISSGKIKLLLAILVISAVVGIVAAITLQGPKRAKMEPVLQKLPQNIDLALHNARFAEMRQGATVWELVAKKAEYDKTGEIAFLSDIRMDFAKTAQNDSITVTAATGDYSSKNNNVRLRGGVQVTTGSGATFTTDSIDYLAAKSLLKTSEKVKFQHQRLSLEAIGMDMNVKDQKARFHRDIDAAVSGGLNGE